MAELDCEKFISKVATNAGIKTDDVYRLMEETNLTITDLAERWPRRKREKHDDWVTRLANYSAKHLTALHHVNVIRRYMEGDKEANSYDSFRALYQDYVNLVRKQAHTHGHPVTEDFEYKVFLAAIESWDDQKSMFHTWLGQMAYYTIGNIRHESRHDNRIVSLVDEFPEDIEHFGGLFHVGTEEENPETLLERQETRRIAASVIAKAPPDIRVLLSQIAAGEEVDKVSAIIALRTARAIAYQEQHGLLKGERC